MERLTNKHEAYMQRRSYENRLEQGYPRSIPEERFLRLAAYEDTGLEPEEVERCKLTLMGKSLAEITEFDGVSIERLKELVRAEKAGRLVVLPCKVGTKVWVVFSDGMEKHLYETRVQGISVSVSGEDVILNFGGYPVQYAWGREVGKTVFLNREEAERALEGGNGDG